MTRDDCAQELLVALERLGFRDGVIGLPRLWPAIAAWWSTPITDLAGSQEQNLAFLLSLSPANRDEHDTVFAGEPPGPLVGRELVCLEFERTFSACIGPRSRRRISGGAAVTFWYEYGPAWQRLRERSSWIELGISTPQLDAIGDGRDPVELVRYVEEDAGVLTVADDKALALTFGGVDDDEEVVVIGTSTRQ
jgi:hypothetical protein